jgi:hypothetical protein
MGCEHEYSTVHLHCLLQVIETVEGDSFERPFRGLGQHRAQLDEHHAEVLKRGPADAPALGRRDTREGDFDVRERQTAAPGECDEHEIAEPAP